MSRSLSALRLLVAPALVAFTMVGCQAIEPTGTVVGYAADAPNELDEADQEIPGEGDGSSQTGEYLAEGTVLLVDGGGDDSAEDVVSAATELLENDAEVKRIILASDAKGENQALLLSAIEDAFGMGLPTQLIAVGTNHDAEQAQALADAGNGGAEATYFTASDVFEARSMAQSMFGE